MPLCHHQLLLLLLLCEQKDVRSIGNQGSKAMNCGEEGILTALKREDQRRREGNRSGAKG